MSELHRRENGEPGWLTLDNGTSLSYEGATDNGGKTFDRYTAGFELALPDAGEDDLPDEFVLTIGPTGNAPNGVCMSAEGGLLEEDERIEWGDLPEPVQRAIDGEFRLFASSEGYRK